METNRPKIGVGVMIYKDEKILLGKRKNAHGDGTRSFPGGHLEFNESVEKCAIRETMEETGIKIKNIRMGPFTNDIFHEENKHYITLFVLCDYDKGEVKVMEPEKCEKRERVTREEFPSPLFLPIKNLKKQGFHPFK
ncbi:MAG: NUDIX hydrolase [Candidatus Absconditabacterales bacterium]